MEPLERKIKSLLKDSLFFRERGISSGAELSNTYHNYSNGFIGEEDLYSEIKPKLKEIIKGSRDHLNKVSETQKKSMLTYLPLATLGYIIHPYVGIGTSLGFVAGETLVYFAINKLDKKIKEEEKVLDIEDSKWFEAIKESKQDIKELIDQAYT